jgi:hypothetical protein
LHRIVNSNTAFACTLPGFYVKIFLEFGLALRGGYRSDTCVSEAHHLRSSHRIFWVSNFIPPVEIFPANHQTMLVPKGSRQAIGGPEEVVAAAAGCAAGWLIGVFAFRHPLSADLHRLGRACPSGFTSGIRKTVS